MKKFKIKYQKGVDIFVTEIEAANQNDARMIFYLANTFCDIITIEEVST